MPRRKELFEKGELLGRFRMLLLRRKKTLFRFPFKANFEKQGLNNEVFNLKLEPRTLDSILKHSEVLSSESLFETIIDDPLLIQCWSCTMLAIICDLTFQT